MTAYPTSGPRATHDGDGVANGDGRRVRKAVIPAAGLGTRFLPATKAQPKEMLPVVDKPAIQYVVEEAVAAGLTDILIITGRGKRTLEDHFDRSLELELALEAAGRHEDLARMEAIAQLARIHYVRQGEARGLGHAVAVAREHIGDEPFAVLLGDDIMSSTSTVLADMLALHAAHEASVVALLEVPPDQISLYGCAAVSVVNGTTVNIRDLVEKPSADEAPSNLAVMGRYVFTPAIFDAIAKTEPGRGGEIQLTDAIALLLASEPVFGHCFTEGRYDIGNKLAYLRATVELALERDDIGGEFSDYLVDMMRRRGLI